MDIKAGQIVILKPEYLDPGEENIPHIALEDSWYGWKSIKVTPRDPIPRMPLMPISDWRLEWITIVE